MAQHTAFWFAVGRATADACIEWPGSRVRGGYGRTWHNGKVQLTHRIAWQLAFGPLPEGVEVCHRCDKPPCCNPAHLFLGTHSENMQDAVAKGRRVANAGSFAGGTKHRNASLTDEQVARIRSTPYRRGSKGNPGSDWELAESLGITRQQVGRIRRGQRW